MVAMGGLAASFAVAAPAGAATATAISTTKSAEIWPILVSRQDRSADPNKASNTPCTAACLVVWPEVVLPKGVKKPQAKGGVNAAKLGTDQAKRWGAPGDLCRESRSTTSPETRLPGRRTAT